MADVLFTYNLDIDPWFDLEDARDGLISRAGVLPEGTESGRPVIAIAIKFEEGDEVIGQITWNQFKQLYETMAEAPAIILDEL